MYLLSSLEKTRCIEMLHVCHVISNPAINISGSDTPGSFCVPATIAENHDTLMKDSSAKATTIITTVTAEKEEKTEQEDAQKDATEAHEAGATTQEPKVSAPAPQRSCSLMVERGLSNSEIDGDAF